MILTQVYKVNWSVRYGTKYCKFDMIIINTDRSFPVFGKILNLWDVHDYLYFQVQVARTYEFDSSHQSYVIIHTPEVTFTAPERLVDYNVYSVKEMNNKLFVPIKYSLEYIIELHIKGKNPLCQLHML